MAEKIPYGEDQTEAEAVVLEGSKTDCSSSSASDHPNTLSMECCTTCRGHSQDCHPVAWPGVLLLCFCSHPKGQKSDPGVLFGERPLKREVPFWSMLPAICHLFGWARGTPRLRQMMCLISANKVRIGLVGVGLVFTKHTSRSPTLPVLRVLNCSQSKLNCSSYWSVLNFLQ